MKNLGVVATANTMRSLPTELRKNGLARLGSCGIRVEFGEHADDVWWHAAGSPDARVKDVHRFLTSEEACGVLSAFGGYNSNQLLHRLDYDVVKDAGKPFIGYSDFTAILNAVYARTGVCCLHGPSFSMLCDPELSDYTWNGFIDLLTKGIATFVSSPIAADDRWYTKAGFGPREWYRSDGWTSYRRGSGEGVLVGGNLETFARLCGTSYMPRTQGAVLFLEDATGANPAVFHRDLVHLLHAGVFFGLSALLIGALPRQSALAEGTLLTALLDDVLGADWDIPTVLGVNCSHVDPVMTLPVGGHACVSTDPEPTIAVSWDGAKE